MSSGPNRPSSPPVTSNLVDQGRVSGATRLGLDPDRNGPGPGSEVTRGDPNTHRVWRDGRSAPPGRGSCGLTPLRHSEFRIGVQPEAILALELRRSVSAWQRMILGSQIRSIQHSEERAMEIGNRSIWRRLERRLVGWVMVVMAFGLEQAVLRSIRRGEQKGRSSGPPP